MTVAVWIIPIQAVSAQAEPTPQTSDFINYQKFHVQKESESLAASIHLDKNHKSALGLPTNYQHAKEIYSGRNYSKEEVIRLINDYSKEYSIDAATPLRIAKCESGYSQFATNSHSAAKGVFQFLDSTWKTKPLAKDHSVFDADANVHTAIWLMGLGKYSMWSCK